MMFSPDDLDMEEDPEVPEEAALMMMEPSNPTGPSKWETKEGWRRAVRHAQQKKGATHATPGSPFPR